MNAADVERVVTAVRAEIGKVTQIPLGAITRELIARFAITIGETNPLHLDPAYARTQGYADIIAPPTMVSSILVWEPGPPEASLRPDGVVTDTVLPVEGFRRMGGGQRLEFVSPVTAGDTITMARKLVDVSTREAKTGALVLVGTEKQYVNQHGQVRVVCRETLILR